MNQTISDEDRTQESLFPTQRNYGLDFFKIVATLVIVLHHYWQVHHIHFNNGINFAGGNFCFGFVLFLFSLFTIVSFIFFFTEKKKLENAGYLLVRVLEQHFSYSVHICCPRHPYLII